MPWIHRLGLICCFTLLACGQATPPAAEAGQRPARAPAGAAPHRRALLVGIDDYSAASLPPAKPAGAASRRYIPNLQGAVNDVREMQEMLVARYGFARQDIFVLTDREATRAAVLDAIERRLIAPTAAGDVVFFHWSGHGSQAVDPGSDKPNHMAATIVPADAFSGARDIYDRELRRRFNRILDRGAHLTILLDSCFSASAARFSGLPTGAAVRSVEPDPRPVEDASPAGPLAEDRGALVLAATQDFDLARETVDERGRPHGAFSLAMLRAMRDAVPGEPAEETFLRARALLQAERAYQQPALAGIDAVRQAALLGQPGGDGARRIVVAVERVESDGTVVLQGGLAYGFTVGSELRLLAPGPEVRIQLTEIDGFARSLGRLVPATAGPPPAALKPGALAELVQWTAHAGPPLTVWIDAAGDVGPAVTLARELARQAPLRGVQWVEDPTETSPTHVLRRYQGGWQLLAGGRTESLGATAGAAAVLARVAGEGRRALFVQLPAPAAVVHTMTLGPGTAHTAIEQAAHPEEATYVLTGRLGAGGLELAWLRSGAARADQGRSSLPARTAWVHAGVGEEPAAGAALEQAVLLLNKVYAWLALPTPAGAGSPYELTLRRDGGRELLTGGTLTDGATYHVVLRARRHAQPWSFEPRYFYVFVIDSTGRSILVFPRNGPQYHNPLGAAAEPTLDLSPGGTVRVAPPDGLDTWFLLSSDEPIPDPWILDWAGVRARGSRGYTSLEELLATTGGWARSVAPLPTPAGWSIERVLFESAPPGAP